MDPTHNKKKISITSQNSRYHTFKIQNFINIKITAQEHDIKKMNWVSFYIS